MFPPRGLLHPGRDDISHLAVCITVPNRGVEALARGLRGVDLEIGDWSYVRKFDINADDELLFTTEENAIKARLVMDY